LLLLVPFICLLKRTEKGDDGDGDGGGGAEDDDDDDRDGVGGRPWRTLGEEQEAEDLQRKLLEKIWESLRPSQRRTYLQFVLSDFRVLFLLREMQSASTSSFRRGLRGVRRYSHGNCTLNDERN